MRLAIALTLTLCAFVSSAHAACPENSIFSGGSFDAISQQGTDAAAQYGQVGFEPWSFQQNCPIGCYDLKAGVLAAVGHANPYGGGNAGVSTVDVYEVTGPAGGSLTFNVSLLVQASVDPYAHYMATIEGPAGASSSVSDQASGEAMIQVTAAPGAPFSIHASLVAGGEANPTPYGDVRARAYLIFSGFPAGYGIVSCQNYDQPVPTRPTTWGGLKGIYR